MSHQKKTLHILIVDDHPHNLAVLSGFLDILGHKAKTADNGIEALEKLSLHTFDLVITDMIMSDMNGDVLAAKIKEQNPCMPVFILTGFAYGLQSDSSKMQFVDKIVTKPVVIEELQKALAEINNV